MRTAVLLLVMFTAFSAASAGPFVVIVRHAEKANNSEDAELSSAGQERAQTLAHILKNAHITAIFTSEFKRTRQTAAPTSTTTGVAPIIVPGKDFATLSSRLREVKGNALVVGHGNTIPDIIKALGIDTPIQIGDDDYSEIFVVTLEAEPQLLRLHYP